MESHGEGGLEKDEQEARKKAFDDWMNIVGDADNAFRFLMAFSELKPELIIKTMTDGERCFGALRKDIEHSLIVNRDTKFDNRSRDVVVHLAQLSELCRCVVRGTVDLKQVMGNDESDVNKDKREVVGRIMRLFIAFDYPINLHRLTVNDLEREEAEMTKIWE